MTDDETDRITILVPQEEVRHLTAAEGYIELGMYKEAHAELHELDPEFQFLQQALVLKLCVYAGFKQWDIVQDIANSMARHEPDNAQWAIWSASAASRAESIEAAKKILLKALETNPNNANIHYNLSCYETRLNHFKLAQQHLARAFQLDPRFKALALQDEDLEPLWIKLKAKK